jgi:hypothetical protein
MRPRMS